MLALRLAAAEFVVEGVDMLLFNDEGKLSTLVQFDMQVNSWKSLCQGARMRIHWVQHAQR